MPFKNRWGGWRTKRNYGWVDGVEVPFFNVLLGQEVDSEELAIEVEKVLDNMVTFGAHGAAHLLDVAHKRRTPYEVYQRWQSQTIKNVETLNREDALKAAFNDWLKVAKRKNGNPLTAVTAHSYTYHMRALLALKPDAKVRDLPALLALYRDECVRDDKPQIFRRTRSTCLSFARGTEKDGQFSALWREIAKVAPMPKKRSSKEGSALPVWEVVEILNRLKDVRMRNVAYGIAFTGMRIGEYATRFEILPHGVRIYGEKTQAADRTAPMPIEFEPEALWFRKRGVGIVRNNHKADEEKPVNSEVFRQVLSKVSDGKLTPHVLRHCFTLWCSEAGLPRTAIAQYLGWSVNSEPTHLDHMLAIYARSNDKTPLEQHTELLVSYIETNWSKPKDAGKVRKVRRLKVA